VLPQAQQKSNIHLSDKEVMGRRTDPVTESMATPLRKSNMESDEPSGRKQI